MFLRTIVFVAFLSAAAIRAEQPAKPSFSGRWKMDMEHSRYGKDKPPKGMEYVIQLNGSKLTVKVTEFQNEGPSSSTSNYGTGGEESFNKYPRYEVKTRIHWEGADLKLDSAVKVTGALGLFVRGDIRIHETWKLSPDGKTLTMTKHQSGGPQGEFDRVWVFTRQ